MWRLLLAAVALVPLAGCPDNKPTFQDAGPVDAAVDAPTDAPVDAPAPLPAYEVTGGAAKLSGSRFKADVQIGHGISQEPVTGGGKVLQGNAAVKP